MVKILSSILFFVVATNVSADEYNKFLKDINSGQNKIDYSQKLIKHDELHLLIPQIKNQGKADIIDEQTASKNKDKSEEKPSDALELKKANSADTDKSNAEDGGDGEKKGPLTASQDKIKASGKKRKLTKEEKAMSYFNSDYFYKSSNEAISNDANISIPDIRKVLFGVTIGSRIKVKLDTGATNVQPGLVAFVTLEDVVGFKKVLPRNTRIFGRPSAVVGSEKLFTTVTRGLTTGDHKEFSVRGVILDKTGNPGLVARIISDGRSLDRASVIGMAELGKNIVDLAPDAMGVKAGKEAGKVVIDEKTNEKSRRNGAASYIVKAAPQHAILQIEETF